ncbi:MAG: serine/threonine-protein kinase [Myxococcaceae bacterium]|nr:serine/threonine-protein kinase [Myxococcaceae bacterium]
MSVDGRVTLEQRLKSGPLPVDEAVRVVWSLCDRFEKSASAETLGDVVPSRVTLYGRIVEVNVPDALPIAGASAPERQRGGPPTPRSDVYAMGALLVHVLTGKPPDGTPLPVGAEHLRPVVAKCLAVDPSARFANLSELKRALVRLDKTLASGPKPSGTQPITRSTLGPWTIEGLLGQGSMGHVFKARHQSLGRLAAIKVLRPEQYQQPELIQRFFQEARTVNQINHEHIVEISDFVQEPGEAGPSAVYCVMEFLQGRTLGDLIEEQPVELSRGLRIVEQLCDALAAAHKVGVVHRDVKPDNIMLIERGGSKDYVKVLDFGVAKLTDTDGKAMVATTEGAIIGTPICMSPEQAQGDAIDARSDVWAVGVILYKLLTGAFPFDAPTFVNIAVQIITKPYAPLPAKNQVGEAIPPRLRTLVEKCLQKQRELRPQSMVELRDELRAILRGEAAPGAPGGRRGLVALGVAVLAAALGVGGFWLTRPPKPPEPLPPVIPPAVLVPLPVLEVDAGPVAEPEDAGAEDELVDAGVADEGDDGGVNAGVTRADAGTRRVVSTPTPKKPIRISAQSVAEVMTRFAPKLRGCQVKEPEDTAKVDGSTVLVITLQQSGKVVRAKMTGSGGGGGLEQCIARVLQREGFPPIEGPLPVNGEVKLKMKILTE